jgi:TRAP-type uncharacterized transport system substrate-binding protein
MSAVTRSRQAARRVRLALLTLRDMALSAGPLVLVVVGLVVAAYWWLNPSPPQRVVLATGPDQSAYAAFGQRYAQALARNGIELVLKPSQGSSHNLDLLRSGEADLGFVQGGSATLTETDQEELTSLGSLFVEPMWLFYRETSALRLTGRRHFTHLRQLKGARVDAGTEGSGVPRLFESILAANRLEGNDLLLSNKDHTSATVALLGGELDALVFVSAPESSLVQMLLQTPGIHLLPFVQSEAYARRFGVLKPVLLPQGVVDLAANIPARDVRLIASTTSLVARADTHPAVLQLMAQTAVALHREPGWFAQAREYPNLAHAELALAPEAERALAGSPSFMQRHLPFWLANLVERMWLALGLILALALPLSRVVPPLYTLRIRSRVFRWYAELRDIEERAAEARQTHAGLAEPPIAVGAAQATALEHALQAALEELDELERKAGQMVVPLAYADELYALRAHIQLVRKKVMPLK